MPRYKLTIEYLGTDYHGWQSQLDGRGVQDSIEDAIEKFCGERVKIFAAGRTDSGVHALGQVAHVDFERNWEPFRISEALNHFLRGEPITILSCEQVSDQFEARFSALARHYEFLILNRRGHAAIQRNRVWQMNIHLDEKKMHDAAQLIVGHHDFTTFRATVCQAKSPMRTLDRLDVERRGNMIHIFASARSFLHSQVRSMVGSLVLVGQGKWTPQDFRAALDAADRAACGPVSPPDGLYLTKVDYPASAP